MWCGGWDRLNLISWRLIVDVGVEDERLKKVIRSALEIYICLPKRHYERVYSLLCPSMLLIVLMPHVCEPLCSRFVPGSIQYKTTFQNLLIDLDTRLE